MDIGESVALMVGVIGTAIAIYQAAILNESKKRKQEIQYLLAGVSNLALAKTQAWSNQIALLPKPTKNEDLELFRIHSRAKDDLMEVHSLVTALEGSIDSSVSASVSMLEKTIKHGELNARLQQIRSTTKTPDATGSDASKEN